VCAGVPAHPDPGLHDREQGRPVRREPPPVTAKQRYLPSLDIAYVVCTDSRLPIPSPLPRTHSLTIRLSASHTYAHSVFND
jgi:hypothetical protein